MPQRSKLGREAPENVDMLTPHDGPTPSPSRVESTAHAPTTAARNGVIEIFRGSTFNTAQGAVRVSGFVRGKVIFVTTREGGEPKTGIMPIDAFRALVVAGQKEHQKPLEAPSQPVAEATPLPTDSLEPSEEEVAEHQRLCSLYDRLSLAERAFVSEQWDYDHRLECWQQRLAAKEEASRIAARRRWQTYGVVAVLLWYGSCCYEAYRGAQYARDRLEWLAQKAGKNSALKAAIEEVDRERYEYYRSLKEDDEP